MNNIKQVLDIYKKGERQEHISLDDVLNKVTQEVIELIQGIQAKDIENIYEEAGDVLINIVSFAHEIGCNMDALLALQQAENPEKLLSMLGLWNEKVQAHRGKYSRKSSTKEEVESVTKSFISTVLSYTNPESSFGEVLERNVAKLMKRKDMYKPKINIEDYIANYPDFPKPGIQFKDISPILANPDALKYVCLEMAESCRGAEKIVALDARGFIFAPIISQILEIPWIMARKPGKLPGDTKQISYDLEYGSNTIEIQSGAIDKGEKVALVDDLLATGGTAGAAVHLIESLGGIVHNCAFVIALDEEFLLKQESRKDLKKYPCSTVVSYD